MGCVERSRVDAPWKPTPGAQRDDGEVPAARYTIADGCGEQPLPVLPAARSGLGPRQVCTLASVEIEKYGTTSGCHRCDACLASTSIRKDICGDAPRDNQEAREDRKEGDLPSRIGTVICRELFIRGKPLLTVRTPVGAPGAQGRLGGLEGSAPMSNAPSRLSPRASFSEEAVPVHR